MLRSNNGGAELPYPVNAAILCRSAQAQSTPLHDVCEKEETALLAGELDVEKYPGFIVVPCGKLGCNISDQQGLCKARSSSPKSDKKEKENEFERIVGLVASPYSL